MAWYKGAFIDAERYSTVALTSGVYLYTIVKSTHNDTITPQVTAGGVPYGVLYSLPAANEAAQVAIDGVVKVRVNSTSHAAIAVNDKLCVSTASSTGKLGGGVIPSTKVANYVIGRAMQTLSSNSTAVITMRITMEGAGSTGGANAP